MQTPQDKLPNWFGHQCEYGLVSEDHSRQHHDDGGDRRGRGGCCGGDCDEKKAHLRRRKRNQKCRVRQGCGQTGTSGY